MGVGQLRLESSVAALVRRFLSWVCHSSVCCAFLLWVDLSEFHGFGGVSLSGSLCFKLIDHRTLEALATVRP